ARLHPREIFKHATQHNAVAFILCHNHPSGHPTPSPEDIELTRRLVQAGKAMGIELLDHIIVTDKQWTSFRDSHLL
ncbi:JAB domain-containing protein, partial [bacterium]|nr:JAB domain-containing protein [bacterium]